MKAYKKPELKVELFSTSETLADVWSDVFGTGTNIPVSTYSIQDQTSVI